MQKPVNQRQLSWLCSENILTAENILNFSDELYNLSDFGPIQSLSVSFSGGVLPFQLSGDIAQVRSEFEQLIDKRFISANLTAVFPQVNNLTFVINTNLSFGQITVSVRDGNDDSAKILFQLVSEAFPRTTGPTDQEIEQLSVKLSSLIKEAEKAVKSSQEAQKSFKKTKQSESQSEEITNKLKSFKVESEKIISELRVLSDEVSQKASTIANFKNQTQSDRDTIQEFRDNIGAIEAKIRNFFDEIDKYKNTISVTSSKADKVIESCREKTDKIIDENRSLQEEIKNHLLKAVGASLFSAFEKRKRKISISKWVWAGLAGIAIVAQVFIFIWLAIHAKELSPGLPFYKAPSFFLRGSASIPIVFFIGYAIHQYAREREYEELYGFKSAISFSLSPYLDLVKDLNKEPGNDKYNEFVINTVKQIFDNPLPSKIEEGGKSKNDTVFVKELLDKVIKLIEKREN